MKILPRPAKPKDALSDIISYLSGPLPHKWPLLGLSMTLTGLILWGLNEDSKVAPAPPQIVYVQSWMADRKDSAILEQQKKDLARYEAALQREQKKFQAVADHFGLEWREEEARNKAQRMAVLKAIDKRLDEKIAKAKAQEAAEAGTRRPDRP